MSDVRDETSDDLEAKLTRALHREADAHDPTAPPTTTIRAAAHRRDRRRQLEIGSAVLVAAALIVVLIVGPWRGNEDAYVGSGPTDAKPPLHLGLDPAAGYQLARAVERRPDADGQPPGTVPGVEGRSTFETILFGGSDLVSPPWFAVDIRTMENPTGPWGDPASNEAPVTVGGRPAVLRSIGAISLADEDPSAEQAWTSIALKWDDRHEVTARYWSLDVEEATAALATLRQDGSGRWSVDEPPAGLRELARGADGPTAGWYQDDVTFNDPTSPSTLLSPTIAVTRTSGPLIEADLVNRALGSVWEQSVTLERTTVRGQPAILVTPGADTDTGLGTLPRFHVTWFEPDHDVVVDLFVYGTDRAQVDRAITSLRDVTDAEWRSTLATCTDVPSGGTIASVPSWASGGPCPGGVLAVGG
jgi:hypothetical protein